MVSFPFSSIFFFFLLWVSLFSQPRYAAACIIVCSFIIIQVSSLSFFLNFTDFVRVRLSLCLPCNVSILPHPSFFIHVLFCPPLSYHVPHFIYTPVILLFLFASRVVFSVSRHPYYFTSVIFRSRLTFPVSSVTFFSSFYTVIIITLPPRVCSPRV